MPNAVFTADFTKFDDALKNARSSIKAFEVSTTGVKQSLQRLTSAFDGTKIQAQAKVAADAVKGIGGAANLTAKEQAKVNAIVTEALAKYKALGQSAPAELKKLQKETAGVATATSGIGSALLKIGGLFAATFTVGAITRAASAVVAFGGQLTDLSARTGIGTKALQEFGFAGGQVGVSLESVTTAVGQMQKRIAGGDDSAVAALNKLGISVEKIRTLQPEQQFALIAEKIRGIEDPAARVKLAMDVMGRGALEVMPLLVSNFAEMQQQAQALGVVLDDETIAALDKMGDTMDALKLVGQAVLARVLVPMAPHLQKLGEFALVVASGMGQLGHALTVAQLSFQGFLVLAAKSAAAMYDMQTAVLQFTKTTQPLANVFGTIDKHIAEASRQSQYYRDLANGLTYDIQRQIAEGLKPQEQAVQASTAAFEPLEVNTKAAAKAAAEHAKAMKQAAQDAEQHREELDAIRGDLMKVASAYDKVAEAADRADAAMTMDDIRAELAQVTNRIEALSDPLEDAFALFGIKSREELRQTAEEAKRAYALIVSTVGAKAPEAIAAHTKMVEAINAATGTIPTYWQTNVFPAIKDVIGHIQTAISGSFAAMLLGAKSFKDGFLDIWESIKKGILNILASIADSFINSFLKGLLGALTGSRGAFGQAFAGLFGGGNLLSGAGLLGGLFGGAGGGAVMGGVPIAGIGGSVGALPGGAAAGGLTAVGLLGGAAAGGAGIGLGMLGKQLFGGAGWKAGAFGAGSGAATGALIGSIVPGIGTAIGAAIGGLAGLITGLFGKTEKMKVNDARDVVMRQAAAQFGGTGLSGTGAGTDFAVLAASLQEATGSGALFDKFLQANSMKDFEAVTREVAAALDAYKQKTDAAAASEVARQAAIAQTTAKVKELEAQMQSLDEEEAALNAREKPEAVMGTVEKRTRARIEAQRKAIEAALQDAKEAQIAAAAEAEIRVSEHLDHLGQGLVELGSIAEQEAERARRALLSIGRSLPTISLRYRYALEGDVPGGEIPGHASGGVFTSPHLAAIAEGGQPEIVGSVNFMTRALEGALAKVGGSTIHVTVNISAMDGASVQRTVRSPEFIDAFGDILKRNERGIRTTTAKLVAA